MLRPARKRDLDSLLELENAAFEADRISRRNFRRLLVSPSAEFVVAEDNGSVAGYALVLFRNSTALARLYSLAVHPGFRDGGIGLKLLLAAEKAACKRGAIFLRLEVREDNSRAISLYEHHGYRRFGRRLNYYEDGGDALRFEKRLTPPAESGRAPVPAVTRKDAPQ